MRPNGAWPLWPVRRCRCILFAPMLTLSGVAKSYGDRVLFADAALQVNRGDRIGLVGPNGAGKSTLFAIVLGEEPVDDGRVNLERDARVGFLPQESAPVGDETAVEIAVAITPDFVRLRRLVMAWDHDHPVEAVHPEDLHDDVHDRFHTLNGYQVEAKARQILAGLGFRERDMERPARELSGGHRLATARVGMQKHYGLGIEGAVEGENGFVAAEEANIGTRQVILGSGRF